MLARYNPEHILDTAINALATGPECRSIIDALPVPIYTVETNGAVTYWNRACADFAGREPELGQDRWCVVRQLFTTAGEPLSSENCPMAQAIRQKRPIRDIIAIAERPDGSRVAFKPFPTPLFDDAGELVGAINLLIDVTDEQSEILHEQAKRCRRLADAMYDRATIKALDEMATGFDKTADDLRVRGQR
jgi:PAS domain S-box-containing protein